MCWPVGTTRANTWAPKGGDVTASCQGKASTTDVRHSKPDVTDQRLRIDFVFLFAAAVSDTPAIALANRAHRHLATAAPPQPVAMSTSRARRAVPVVVVRSDMIDEHKATVVEAVRDLMRVVQSPDAAIALTAELRIPVLHGSDGSSKGAAGRGRGKLEQHNPLLAAVLKQRLDASVR